ncbi:MAG: hypothetical protein V1875_02070 [Candidatus Altiarchaeota archaeon]
MAELFYDMSGRYGSGRLVVRIDPKELNDDLSGKIGQIAQGAMTLKPDEARTILKAVGARGVNSVGKFLSDNRGKTRDRQLGLNLLLVLHEIFGSKDLKSIGLEVEDIDRIERAHFDFERNNSGLVALKPTADISLTARIAPSLTVELCEKSEETQEGSPRIMRAAELTEAVAREDLDRFGVGIRCMADGQLEFETERHISNVSNIVAIAKGKDAVYIRVMPEKDWTDHLRMATEALTRIHIMEVPNELDTKLGITPEERMAKMDETIHHYLPSGVTVIKKKRPSQP